jgi:hypothetical protein
MSVIIGVDPHQATHTAVAIEPSEAELAQARVRATARRLRRSNTAASELAGDAY